MIYEVRAETPEGRVHSFGHRNTEAEATELMAVAVAQVEKAGGTNRRYWVEAVDPAGSWPLPPKPTPRERFTARPTALPPDRPGVWNCLDVRVYDGDTEIEAARYERNYFSMYDTFEPFRQGDRMFALISRHYTGTAVMDLATGEIVAEEPRSGNGFCPVGFYVPDWWDIHDDSILPGTMYWDPADDEWPTGDFGFVWGCHWGDDTSWKVQYLDLSRVADGVISRDDRFGYIRLATHPKLEPADFIRCESDGGVRRVTFAVEQDFRLDEKPSGGDY